MDQEDKKGFPVFSRININAANRLRRVRKDWGFKSSYQIIQYIIYCFIRVADIKHAEPNEDLPPKEVKQIFNDLHSNSREFDFIKPKTLKKHEKISSNPISIKVKANISAKQLERLNRIRETYRFTSNYEILQYSIACFIRALDTANETVVYEPEEIEDMFNDYEESEKHFEYVKPKRSPNESKQKQSLYN